MYTRGLVRFPWSNDIFATGPDAVIVRGDVSLEHLQKNLYLKSVLSSIEGALVTTTQSGDVPLFLLQDDGGKYRLKATNLKELDGTADTPWFGGALVWTRSGLFLLDRASEAKPFALSAENQSPVRVGISSNFYTRLLSGASDLQTLDRLRTVYVRQGRAGWFRITKDRKWSPVKGLPNELMLTTFDPGQGEMLLGMADGVYAINADGQARKLEGVGVSRGVIRAIARSGKEIIAGGNEGLFQIANDLSTISPIPNASIESIGSVDAIRDVGFAGFDIVEASNGTYAFEGGKLTRIAALASSARYDHLGIFPQLKRVLVARRVASGPMIFELARKDTHGECAAGIEEQQ
jgi:hypothetical protein